MKLIGMGIVCMVCVVANAADDVKVETKTTTTKTETVVVDEKSERIWKAYNCNEVEFLFFGTGAIADDDSDHLSSDRIERDGKLGAGAGLAYFFHRYIGIEGYTYSESTGGKYFVDHIAGNLIGRFPLGNSGVAPYVLIGGGRQIDPITQWTVDAGGGIQWRFLNHVGIFADARYVWADETRDYALGRLGLKFGF